MNVSRHPREPDWANLALPDAWIDGLRWRNPRLLWRLAGNFLFGRRTVRLPDDLWGRDAIPRYVLQEFHHLPNGNYSNLLTRGYLSGFDASMLGCMQRTRQAIASRLRDCRSVLDLGCGGGATAAALQAAGCEDVWALDPSPYLLQHGARDFPGIRFVHGVMEDLPFEDCRFDGISVCFAFHEVPPASARAALGEIARVLRPGGLLAMAEPSALQFRSSLARMVREHGWRGAWFWALVRVVHEPYLARWHDFPLRAEASRSGFEIVAEADEVPVRSWLLRKTGSF
jgi:SAM-dependent methyltransferase